MRTLRRHMRVWVASWLIVQVASLSALVSRDCCADHRHAASVTEHRCHETPPQTSHCATPEPEDALCPLHRDNQEQRSEKPDTTCSMRGSCDGPMATLLALLSNQGVMTDSLTILPDLDASRISNQTRDNLLSRFATPDPPPPRV